MKLRILTIPALVLLCGAAAAAQDTYRPPRQDRQDQPARDQTRPRDGFQPDRQQAPPNQEMRRVRAVRVGGLIPSEWAVGANVVSTSTGETLGSVDDLALRAPDGRITHAIVSRGGVLGIGSQHIAVPWNALAWNAGDRNLSLPMTEEQLRDAPKFDTDQWAVLNNPQWIERTNSFFSVRPGDDRGGPAARAGGTGDDLAWMEGGRFQNLLEKGQRATIRGTVQSVDRKAPMQGMSEGYILTVTDQQNQEHHVHLGPSWFLQHQTALPRRGDQVEIQGTTVSLEGRDTVVARTVSAPEGTLRLRDEQGRPAWDATTGGRATARGDQDEAQPGGVIGRQPDQPDQPGQPARPGERILGAPEARDGQANFLQVSKLKGQEVTAEGEEAGEVQNVVFDSGSGRVAFVTVSFGGFLGMGETDVAVPWELISVGNDGNIVLRRADRETLRSAPRVEGDWETILRDPGYAHRVYQHFGLDSSWLREEGGPRGQNRMDDDRMDRRDERDNTRDDPRQSPPRRKF